MSEVYEPPKSSLINQQPDEEFSFERFSTWAVIGLTIISLGLYIPYWLYTRTQTLNSLVENKISPVFTNCAAAIYIATLVFSFGVAFFDNSQKAELISSIGDLLSSVVIIVWAFKFKNRLQTLKLSVTVSYNSVLTFFFQNFYLQYKINQTIDFRSETLAQAQSLKA